LTRGGTFPASVAGALGDVADALRFFTRLPLPAAPAGPLDFNRIAWAAPVAGAVVGAVGAGVLALSQVLELPALVSAALATASVIAATGALHEDGLADVADGFGGGRTRERKLEIMRDSRIGAFGAIALTLALILRVGALASVLSHGLWSAAGALIVVVAVSRTAALMPLALIDPARSDGAGAAAGRLEPTSFAAACGAGLILAVALGLLTVGAGRAIDAALASAIAAAAMTALALRQIGGQTGDVAGAAHQWAEIAGWCGLLTGRFAA
jgi:adenosylcobinamide-GDP ribazoletransferase